MRALAKQAGDTIVEVLIAITVTAGVLGASYTVVNRTMANAQQAQEHTEALQIANKQIEFITTLATSDGASALYDGTPRYKCADKTTGELVGQTALLDLSDDRYDAACVADGNIAYKTAFEYVTEPDDPSDPNDAPIRFIRVYVTWPSVTGKGNDQVSVVYRAY